MHTGCSSGGVQDNHSSDWASILRKQFTANVYMQWQGNASRSCQAAGRFGDAGEIHIYNQHSRTIGRVYLERLIANGGDRSQSGNLTEAVNRLAQSKAAYRHATVVSYRCGEASRCESGRLYTIQ